VLDAQRRASATHRVERGGSRSDRRPASAPPRKSPMTWTFERKRDACVHAPIGRDFIRDDTTIIERPGWYQVITPSAPANVWNEVLLSQVADADAERVIDETCAAYRAAGHRTKWCVGHWTKPHDFGDRLARRGFLSWDVRGMGRETDTKIPAAHDVRVEEVTLECLDVYLTTMLRGWSLPEETAAIERHVHLRAFRAEPRTAHVFLARVDGEIAGTGGVVHRGDVGYLIGTQVLEAARGRGVYRAIVAARLAHLRERGIEYAVTWAREETSAPRLEHLGFETLFRSKCYLSGE
jgi:hypothetical protein